MGSEDFIWDRGEKKKCLAACQDQKHDITISQAKYPSRNGFHTSSDVCTLIKRLTWACTGDRRKNLNEYKPELCHNLERLSARAGNETCDMFQTESEDQRYRSTKKKIRIIS